MIDEKKLIESLKESYGLWGLVGIDEVVKIIKSQPQIEKCGDCSRRKFYQQGYEAGKRECLKVVLEKLKYLLNNFGWHCEEWEDDGKGECNHKSCSDCVLNHAIEIVEEEAT